MGCTGGAGGDGCTNTPPPHTQQSSVGSPLISLPGPCGHLYSVHTFGTESEGSSAARSSKKEHVTGPGSQLLPWTMKLGSVVYL